ncbi:MAG: MscS Mechanosensitive ion channel [Candidatus Moranbacteria bacterium GW2011_GWE2_35_2-]|nr:MAG: MscS Mechanosensitive ion channel [Candidatus Moranbacteria bacterium GW2011_GWE2_35_2-]KKQ22228.1 MAG: MscS Mechanosensitive ion channel [Candidatus Moranbacteria bacterium GW2011_GWF2_37_11]KKQ28716.1 MAG: MscS Mechanosensitive ion channel [Candidatus Moranbacteria bacterium GW2011_GWD1_37_17]KKQ30280.1 MAG: MscS Mechanosensitive ion channel [Candidatus Moranbacteria bacterium GW2011_GWE1_37_24]KKQ46924.1 MAG: MscS Mechanosensitive ion channel [Candidatus Moranbacteria bacterium GW201
MNFYQKLSALNILGSTGNEYLHFLLVFVLWIAVFKLFQVLVMNRLQQFSDRTKTDLDNFILSVVKSIKPPFYFIIALYVSFNVLVFSANIEGIIKYIVFAVIAIQVVLILQKVVDYVTIRIAKKAEADGGGKEAIYLGGKIVNVALWVVAILMVLSNLGFNVSSVLAGLGIGGIAVALAAQNVLGDIFSSFSIVIDKPFKVGDFVSIGTEKGTVKKIGIKTTRLKTLQGEELVISNKDLTNARVQNFKRLKRRRVSFNLGIVYGTKIEKLKKIPEIIKGIIEKEELASFGRVHFRDYGDFSLIFKIIYYVESGDFKDYMNVRQNINLAVYEAFEKEGIDFAYPTQTIMVSK